MTVFWKNVDKLLQEKEPIDVSLYCGSMCLPPYVGFKKDKTIYVIAFLNFKTIKNLYKNPKKNFKTLINDIFHRRNNG